MKQFIYTMLLFVVATSSTALSYTPPTKLTRKTHDGGPVDPDTDARIKNIMDTYNLSKIVSQIRKFNKETLDQFYKNALMCKFNSTNPEYPSVEYILYIDEEWFNSLPECAQEFLVCHEIMHIKLHHFNRDLNPANEKHAAILREQEQEADIAAAKLLESAQGGIEFCFQFINEQYQDYYRSYPEKLTMAPAPHDDHPTIGQRISYLKELKIRL